MQHMIKITRSMIATKATSIAMGILNDLAYITVLVGALLCLAARALSLNKPILE